MKKILLALAFVFWCVFMLASWNAFALEADQQQTYNLAAGDVLTVAAPPGATGSVIRLSTAPGGTNQSITAINGATLTFGPYAANERFKVIVTAGTVTVSSAKGSPVTSSNITTAITDGDTTNAPNGNAVYDALALKAPIASPTFTGTAVFPVLALPEKTPVNAVAAAKVITFSGAPAKGDTDKITITAVTKGTVGNDIVIGETVDQASWAAGATKLSGGVDATTCVANETVADGSFIYHCVATGTTADTNWRKVSLGTAY